MRAAGFDSMETVWMGSDFDGSFAEYVKVPAAETFVVESELSDAELGSIPCAYGTAENMLHRAQLKEDERVLVTGASGGVGSAVVQLAKRRGTHVTAIAGRSKIEKVRAIGADHVVARGEELLDLLGEQSIDLVVDNVGGAGFPRMLELLKRGGRYVSSGAIGGPLVDMDMRTVYLKDLTIMGTTAWDEAVFPNLVSYIERAEIRPLVARTFPLEEIASAQRMFIRREHVGKFVLIPRQGKE
jgi:NADPH:quinone reductase-like Zn-dependent oxidoreductase